MTKLLYGFNDPKHSIICYLKDITFSGMDIIITAITEDGSGLITAPVEMFKNI